MCSSDLFRTTVGIPGIATISAKSKRPSVAVGIGPGRLTVSRDPGASLAARYVAVGVTSRPLLWARIGPLRVKVPGQVPGRGQRRWHEELDDQWKPYYERRPPSVSEDLHFLIRDMERDAVRHAARTVSVPPAAPILRAQLSDEVIEEHRQIGRAHV